MSLLSAETTRSADYFLAPQDSGYTGTQQNNSHANPIPFNPTSVGNLILSDIEVNLFLISGTYELVEWHLPSNTPAALTLRIMGINALGAAASARPLLRYRVPTANLGAVPEHLFDGPAWKTWLLNVTVHR